ncbi:toxin-antitoxin system, antitoxin component, ArsR family [Leptospira licerasiae str. MMD4847]|uniref:Toxin-antitoxin system, antitoxin component, ArsR family n=1 Tax=Leptospira licerasiae str. MMD4847 TaxID=1049971 RepID=A0ABP2R8L9_9LEPT|nr:toxin-antitoxin system, antitoxin component, ArsR family [Leptospira licerasiae str. MMD4847]
MDANKMKEIADFIEPFRNMWDDRFNKLESVMKKYKSRK